MNFAKLISKAVEFGPRVSALVVGVKNAFGTSKTGPEKAEIVFNAIARPDGDDAVEIFEGLVGRDIINNPAAEALVRELIETQYQAMKLDERRKAILAQLKSIKGTGGPVD